jgi:hypothetical protein
LRPSGCFTDAARLDPGRLSNELLAPALRSAHLPVSAAARCLSGANAMSRHQTHKLIQQFLVAATSLCVGIILARVFGF